MNLTDKLAVVTGAGSGIGRATAHAFAAEGARVIACDVDPARLETLRAELGSRLVLAHTVDVASRDEMAAFADAVHVNTDAVDVIVNNAGVAVGASFLDTSLDDWDWLLGVNLRGVVHGCHFFAKPMVKAGRRGHVINVSSILGIYPAPMVSAYVASKFAVLGMSQSLRAELAEHGIGVTAICPGLISTEIVSDGRMLGRVGDRKQLIVERFYKRGSPPSLVADAIIDAVRTNPAVRTVGKDAGVLHAVTRVAPTIATRVGQLVARRLSAR
ncbi:MAG: SDR family NAD(P)-dependent oxidoreductase [Kofleriaceae bacterium]|nr:SDR family NAD(P)-dependent oxidoreductase [Kofleriaceae bacterium]